MPKQENLFSEVKSDGGGVAFPMVLVPNPNASKGKPVQLAEAIQANKPWLESLLHQSGAVLFRGFPVSNASDFNDAVGSFGYDDFGYDVGGLATRTKVCGRVYTANESPPDQKIGFHHEMAHVSEFPTKLFFFCDVEPGSGGETCIVQSHVIYEKMKLKHPEFVQQIEEKGLLYIRVLGEEFDPSSSIGRGWKVTFMADDKCTAEKRAAMAGVKLEWMEKGAVKVIVGPVPGSRYDEAHQRMVWFNSLAVSYGGVKDELNEDPAKGVVFGDGEPLPPDIVQDLLKTLDEECVALQWRKGDVLLLDNWAVLHARLPLLAPPRRILASLCK